METKYVFVTGGVISGLGKGITAASLGRLLKNRGYKVAAQIMRCDSDSGKKLIKSMVLRTADRQGMC